MESNEDYEIGRFCRQCFEPIEAEHWELARRVERVEVLEVEGKTVDALHILSDEVMLDLCNGKCWKAKEPEAIEVFALVETYPKFSGITFCCSCGKTINRAKFYTSLCIYHVIDKETPDGMVSNHLDDVEFAVLCSDCGVSIEEDSDEELRREKA